MARAQTIGFTYIATMETDPAKAYNQDNATGFIRLSGPVDGHLPPNNLAQKERLSSWRCRTFSCPSSDCHEM